MEELIPLTAIVTIFMGVPWLFLHYLTKWKQAKSITVEDENLLDELHDIARRLDDRLHSIERIVAADRDLPSGLDGRVLERPAENSSVELRSRSYSKDI